MTRHLIVGCAALLACILISCASPEGVPTATISIPPTVVTATATNSGAPATVTPTAPRPPLGPGDTVGEMVIRIARDDTGEPSIFNYCVPVITPSDPSPLVRECNVPASQYLFIGYGDFAKTLVELDAIWKRESWEMYLDGDPVDLSAFGTVVTSFGSDQLRLWNIAIDNPTPGLHKLRYVIRQADSSDQPMDATWIFTLGGNVSQTQPTPVPQKKTYPVLASTINPGQHPYTSKKAGLNFLLYVPAAYGNAPQQEWPLILYLHGAGERGNNLDYLKVGGLPRKLEDQTDFPFIVVSPQTDGEHEFWSETEIGNALSTLLQEIQTSYAVDAKRIYLTGVSAGGNGTWEIALRNPARFAALVPVAGYYGFPFKVPDNICDLKDVPIWAFHGAKDETVPLEAEEGLVMALKACGGDSQLTVYPAAGHDIGDQVYANSDLYTWLSSQTLK